MTKVSVLHSLLVAFISFLFSVCYQIVFITVECVQAFFSKKRKSPSPDIFIVVWTEYRRLKESLRDCVCTVRMEICHHSSHCICSSQISFIKTKDVLKVAPRRHADRCACQKLEREYFGGHFSCCPSPEKTKKTHALLYWVDVKRNN